MKRSTTLLLTAVLSAPLAAFAAQPPLRCVIEPDRIAEVGTPVIGVVESIHVERGDFVRQGQLLAQLRANVEHASVSAAQARAQADADIQAAAANYEFQKQKLARTEELMQKKFVSAQALDQVRAETAVAEQRLAQAKEQRRVAKEELELARAQLGLRAIRAPFSGVVADRYVNPGERVEVKPMFRIAKLDPLRVEVIAPAAMFGTIKKGMAAQITPELPNAARLDAKVVLVDRLIDAASNTFRVRAELPNANSAVPSGVRCRAEVAGVTEAVQPAAAPKAGARMQPRAQASLRMDTRLTGTATR
ncbi:MAG TPA: efflux RND transporter periplasmic adaptor subunit [Burkholderiales bacterium]|nr:efflux RND transporter periplasmic adaptor subunit [Burkholderiales bacterium]